MYIINLLMIILAAFLIACLTDKKTEDILPPTVFSLLLGLYLIAIAGKSHHSYEATLLIFVLVWAFYIIRTKRVFPGLSQIKKRLITPAMIFFIAVAAVMFLAYSNHFITVWDDFHYNATLPKDMFYYGTMPTGNHSATFYRSYLPLMQLFFYWGFQGGRAFSEPMMFAYKMFLIYTCMLPLFKPFNEKRKLIDKILTGICALIMPYLLMFELLESLSMDTFMALLFGYALWHIIFEEKKDLFNHIKIALALACLTMVKQLGILFTLIALFTWAIVLISSNISDAKSQDRASDKKIRGLKNRGFIAWLLTAVINALFWVSWKIFCNIKGNSVYLSGKLKDSVNGSGIAFPPYAADTVKAFIRSVFTYSLDLAPMGMTLIVTVVISLFIFVMMKRSGKIDRSGSLGIAAVYLGLLGYLLVLIYTYLFVFEDWEAESLSSIDRYFGTYGLTLLYLALGILCLKSGTEEGHADGVNKKTDLILLTALTMIFLICTPWAFLYRNLIPTVYLDTHRQAYNDMNSVREEMVDIKPEALEVRTVMVVTSEGNSIYSRGMLYNFIPLIPAEYIIDEPTPDHSQELLERCADSSAYYVYFSGKLLDDKDKMDSIRGAFAGGLTPEPGKIYYYDRENNIINHIL